MITFTMKIPTTVASAMIPKLVRSGKTEVSKTKELLTLVTAPCVNHY